MAKAPRGRLARFEGERRAERLWTAAALRRFGFFGRTSSRACDAAFQAAVSAGFQPASRSANPEAIIGCCPPRRLKIGAQSLRYGAVTSLPVEPNDRGDEVAMTFPRRRRIAERTSSPAVPACTATCKNLPISRRCLRGEFPGVCNRVLNECHGPRGSGSLPNRGLGAPWRALNARWNEAGL
jgi:hypothetical protein